MERLLAMWKATAHILLDVRPDVEHDGEPYIRMIEGAQAIKSGETCVIIAPFEPILLYDILQARGFLYEAQQVAHDEWVVCLSPVTHQLTTLFTKKAKKRYAFITPGKY